VTLNVSVFDLIKNFDANGDNKVSFGEFVSAFWTLEKRDEDLEMIESGSVQSLPQFAFQPMGITELKVSFPQNVTATERSRKRAESRSAIGRRGSQ
jgi:hypothetical protein